MNLTVVATLFALGFALSAAPGALNVETLRRGLHDGFWPAFQIQLGALAGDTAWIVTTTVAAGWGLQSPHALTLCMLAGGALLLWTAWRVSRPFDLLGSSAARGRHGRGFALGAVLALTSPLTVAFWAAVNGLVRDRLGRAPGAAELVVVGTAYVGSVLTWGLILSAVAVWGRRWVQPTVMRVANICCAVLLALWGVQLLGQATGRLVV